DVFLVGEAEEMLPEFLDFLGSARERGWSRERILEEAWHVAGVYVPRLYEPVYDGASLIELRGPRGAERVNRCYVDYFFSYPATTEIVADDVAFGDMFLVEASRGCQ